jgi:coenzyme F420-reducing hydrogenase beta subunit
LHHALALKPWEASPFASEDSEDLHGAGSAYSASLPQARALRQALEERARSPK